jgi:cell division protein FtsI/penicillin-binding protein 2
LEAEVEEEVEITSLPSAIFADDPSILRAVISVLEEDSIKTQNGLAPLREEVFVRSAEKVSEEANLASVIDELQDLDVEANDEQRYRMMSVLKTIRGYVGTLLANSHSDEVSTSLDGPFADSL